MWLHNSNLEIRDSAQRAEVIPAQFPTPVSAWSKLTQTLKHNTIYRQIHVFPQRYLSEYRPDNLSSQHTAKLEVVPCSNAQCSISANIITSNRKRLENKYTSTLHVFSERHFMEGSFSERSGNRWAIISQYKW